VIEIVKFSSCILPLPSSGLYDTLLEPQCEYRSIDRQEIIEATAVIPCSHIYVEILVAADERSG